MAIGNARQLVAPSLARTATVTFGPFENPNGRTLQVDIDATASAATPSVVPKIQEVTPQGDFVDLLTGAAITGAGNVQLFVGPDLAASANVRAQREAPRRWQLVMTAGDADSLTYSAWATYLK